MRNGFIIEILTSFAIQEIFKIGGKVITVYGVLLIQKIFEKPLFRNIIEKLIALGQRYKDNTTIDANFSRNNNG